MELRFEYLKSEEHDTDGHRAPEDRSKETRLSVVLSGTPSDSIGTPGELTWSREEKRARKTGGKTGGFRGSMARSVYPSRLVVDIIRPI